MADEYTYTYEPPAFLLGQSADEIHTRMLDNGSTATAKRSTASAGRRTGQAGRWK